MAYALLACSSAPVRRAVRDVCVNAMWAAYPFESHLYGAPAMPPASKAAADAATEASMKQRAEEDEATGSLYAHAPRFVSAVFINAVLDYAVLQWHYNREYFEVLDRFSLLGERAVRFLVEERYGARLLDLYLGPQSHIALMGEGELSGVTACWVSFGPSHCLTFSPF